MAYFNNLLVYPPLLLFLHTFRICPQTRTPELCFTCFCFATFSHRAQKPRIDSSLKCRQVWSRERTQTFFHIFQCYVVCCQEMLSLQLECVELKIVKTSQLTSVWKMMADVLARIQYLAYSHVWFLIGWGFWVLNMRINVKQMKNTFL